MKHRAAQALAAVALPAVAFLIGCSSMGIFTKATPVAKPAQDAEAYYQWLMGCLDSLERDLPQIVASAETAARKYVDNEKCVISSIGEKGFQMEALGRSGGLMRFLGPTDNGVLLFVPRDDHLQEDLALAAQYRAKNCLVIAVARRSVLQAAHEAGAQFDSEIDNHAAEHGGLFLSPDAAWRVPTDPTANAAALWVWTGEFVAACTRLGKMPPIYLGFAVPGGFDRAKKIGQIKFHLEPPIPMKPCVAGAEFLRELRKDLAALHAKEMRKIRAVADLAAKTRDIGRTTYIFAHGHAFMAQIGCAHDPGYFTQINADWFRVKEGIKIEPGDFVFCLGFNVVLRGKQFNDFDQTARRAGARLAWSITSYIKDEVKAIPRGEILIDQHWAFGDAVVTVPGYDVKMLPTSGVLAEAVLWMVNAELFNTLRMKPREGHATALAARP